MPVETSGISGRTSGTAWAIMLDPIKARFLSAHVAIGFGDDHLAESSAA